MQWLRLLRSNTAAVLVSAMFLASAAFIGVFAWQKSQRVLSYAELERVFVPGIHGVTLYAGTTSASFDPWIILQQNRSLSEMVERLCGRVGSTSTCARDKGNYFQVFVKGHSIDIASSSVVLVRGAVPVAETDLTQDFVGQRLGLMSLWARKNQRADGSFPYLYYPSAGTYPSGDNVIRQMITVQGLYAIARVLNDPQSHDRARLAEKHLMRTYYHYDANRGYGYMIEPDGEIKLGAAALAVLALREGKTDDAPLTREERALGDYLLASQRADGSFQTFLRDEPTDENDRFYSGEALTAIARLYEITGESKYLEALDRSLPHYREKLERDFYPQYAPWHAQAYAIAYRVDPKSEYADYVYFVSDALIEGMLQSDADALPDEEGRFFNPKRPDWGPPHSSSTGIYTEGLTYAYELAERRGDTAKMDTYRQAILKGTRSMLHVQWTPESAYYLNYPDRVIGALKRTVTDNRHRIDQTGHAANAIARAYTLVF